MSLRLLARGKRITIVGYHSICPEPHRYALSPEAFERQVAFLSRTYPIARLRDMKAVLSDGRATERLIIITFDDAYTDFREYAFPVLERYSVPCTLFVPTAFIGGFNEWDLPAGRSPKRAIMSERELWDLADGDLVDLGSHTVDHSCMAQLPTSEMQRQVIESKRALEALLNRSVTMFSYPYGQLGDFSRTTTQVLSQAGYEVAVTTHWGTRNRASDILRLRRIFFREQDRENTLRAKVEGQYDWIGSKERLGYAARTARALMKKALRR